MFINIDVKNKLSLVVSDEYRTVFYDQKENTVFIPLDQINYLELATFIEKYPYSDLRILSSILIHDEVVDAIANNQSIVFIKLGSKEDPYTLTREVFDLLNTSESLFSIDTAYVEGKYTTKEMSYLSFFQKMVVQNYSIEDLLTEKTFIFYQSITDHELDYLKKYLTYGVKIDFQYGDYSNILKVIRVLNGRQIHFSLQKYDDLSFYTKDFRELLIQGEDISFLQTMDFSQYVRIDLLLELMVKDIKESYLSPYERYLGVYEIVTHFKEYLENEDNWKESRELEYILFNEFYVCYGVNELMKALLDKVGIKACNVSVEYYKEKEEINSQEQEELDKQLLYIKLGNKDYHSRLLKKIGNTAYHSRLLVKLNDPKYEIDGIFIADPTWDISIDHHLFEHSLLTFYEMKLEEPDFYETDVSIFGVTNSKEFIELVNRRKSVISYFLKIIQVIDKSYYQYLDEHYDLKVYSNEMLLDIYEYILKYTKHPVLLDKRKNALEELFMFIYPSLTKEERNKFMKELDNDNRFGKGKVI